MKLNIENYAFIHRALFQVRDSGITYYFRNKRLAKKYRDKFPVLKKRVELGPDHWRYEK